MAVSMKRLTEITVRRNDVALDSRTLRRVSCPKRQLDLRIVDPRSVHLYTVLTYASGLWS
jgi:hypothetical protein